MAMGLGSLKAQTTLIPKGETLPTFTFSDQKYPKQIRQSVYKVRLIKKEFIQNTNSINLADVLRSQSGLSVVNDNLTGTSTLTMNGQEGKNVQILINGVPIIGRMLGQVDLSQINLQDVEAIEIVEGPLSSIYGANATAGAINIVTRKSQNKKMEAVIKSQYISVGSNNNSLYFSLPIKEWTSNISFGRNFFPGKSFDPAAVRKTDWMLKNQKQATLGIQGKLNQVFVSYRLSYLDEIMKNKREPYPIKEMVKKDGNFYEKTSYRANDIHYLSHRMDHQLSLVIKTKKFDRIEIQNAFNFFGREKRSLIHFFENHETNLDQSAGVQDTTSFLSVLHRTIFAYGKNPTLQIYSGYDVQKEWGKGKRLMNNQQDILSTSLFGNVDVKMRRNSMNFGARLDFNSRFGWSVLPNFQFRKDGSKGGKWTSALTYGQRNPDLKELYLNFIDANHNITGNEFLAPEWGYNLILGHEKSWEWSSFTVTNNINLNANWMNNKIQLLVIDPTTAKYINLGHLAIRNLSYGIGLENFSSSFQVRNLLTQTSVKNEPPKFSYQGTVNLSKKTKFLGLQCNLNANYFFNQTYFSFNTDGADVGIKHLEPYFFLDFFLSKTLSKNHRISAGLNNLFNVQQLNVIAASQGQHGNSSNITGGLGRTYQINYQWTL